MIWFAYIPKTNHNGVAFVVIVFGKFPVLDRGWITQLILLMRQANMQLVQLFWDVFGSRYVQGIGLGAQKMLWYPPLPRVCDVLRIYDIGRRPRWNFTSTALEETILFITVTSSIGFPKRWKHSLFPEMTVDCSNHVGVSESPRPKHSTSSSGSIIFDNKMDQVQALADELLY